MNFLANSVLNLTAQLVKNLLRCGRPGFDPWVWKIPWRRARLPYPLQDSGLENPMDCMDCTVHGVTKIWRRLNDFHFQYLKPPYT